MSAVLISATPKISQDMMLFKATDPNIHYIGRIDFSNLKAPRMWSAGVYIKAKFKGPACEVLINDQVYGGDNHNYIEIAIDEKTPYRIQLKEKVNVVKVPDGLSDGDHVITICKDTESHMGYIDFIGFKCLALLPLPPEPEHKIEFIGDSMTSGSSMDAKQTPCGTGQWYDQHNAYMSYGAVTARNLNAQWSLTSVSGIGLVHSCCDMAITMPQLYDKVYLHNDSLKWDFRRYKADVVTICLGQNDGKQDSVVFCNAYLKFIGVVRKQFPAADIIALNSPMADYVLNRNLKRYLTGVVRYENNKGDANVYAFFFSKRFHNGCADHPDIAEHKQMADELTAYIKKIENW